LLHRRWGIVENEMLGKVGYAIGYHRKNEKYYAR